MFGKAEDVLVRMGAVSGMEVIADHVYSDVGEVKMREERSARGLTAMLIWDGIGFTKLTMVRGLTLSRPLRFLVRVRESELEAKMVRVRGRNSVRAAR